MAIFEKIRTDQPKNIRSINPRISKTLENLVGQLLTKDPVSRIQNAADVHQVLEQYLAHLHYPNSRPKPVVKPPKINRERSAGKWFVGSMAVVGLLAAVGFGWLIRGGFAALKPEEAVQPNVNFTSRLDQIVQRYELWSPDQFQREFEQLNLQIQQLDQLVLPNEKNISNVKSQRFGSEKIQDELYELQNQIRQLEQFQW